MKILAINPWIYDFAAYDFWLKPYGFLVILQYLKTRGAEINFVDCLDKKETIADYGRGKYHKETIEKPSIFKTIPRYYKRYGITLDEFNYKIKNQKPDFIAITSSMTYWYPGIRQAVTILKETFPKIPLILGGTYATLCYKHAIDNIGCDYVFANENLEDFLKLLGVDYGFEELYSTLPDYKSFYEKIDYAVFRTSWGCPFNCSYCAIKKLFPRSLRLPYQKVVEFITDYAASGVRDFVLYDDAFLTDQEYAKAFLSAIIRLKLNVRFHTPNALHLRYLDEEIAHLLKASGFINPHFGLETLDPGLQKLWGDKVDKHQLLCAINLLKKAGFNNGGFSVYLLLGYPGQDLTSLKKDIEFLNEAGARTSFAEFSPVPGTKLFEEYKDNFGEPLLQNNSIFGSFGQARLKEFWEIKNYLRELNKKLRAN